MEVIQAVNMKEAHCLKLLREKIEDDESLKAYNSTLDDRFLLHFVRGRKYNADKAVLTLRQYIYVRKEKYPKMFVDYLPSQTFLYRKNCVRLLKSPGPKGQLVVTTSTQWWPAPKEELYSRKNPAEDLMYKMLQVSEEIWNFENAEENGVECIVDLSTFEWTHLKIICSVPDLIKVFSIFYGAMPLRYIKIHAVHPPRSFKILYNFVKMVAPRKLVDRLIVHNDNSGIHEHLPKSILPAFFGGDVPDDETWDYDYYERTISKEKDEYYKQFNTKLGLTES